MELTWGMPGDGEQTMARHPWLAARGVSCPSGSRNVLGFSKENCPALPDQA